MERAPGAEEREAAGIARAEAPAEGGPEAVAAEARGEATAEAAAPRASVEESVERPPAPEAAEEPAPAAAKPQRVQLEAELPKEVLDLFDPDVLERLSRVYASKVDAIYLNTVRSAHVVRFARDLGPEEALKELVKRSGQGYARLLASLDNRVEVYVFAYKGVLCVAAVTPYLQPLSVSSTGVRALTEFFRLASEARQRRYVITVIPEEELDPYLECSAYAEEVKRRKHERETEGERREGEKRGILRLLSIFRGGRR